MTRPTNQRLFELFNAYSAETLTDAELAELQDALRRDEEARRWWFLHQDVELGMRIRSAMIQSTVVPFPQKTQEPTPGSMIAGLGGTLENESAQLDRLSRRSWLRPILALAVAAVVVVAIGLCYRLSSEESIGLILASTDEVVEVIRDEEILQIGLGAALKPKDLIIAKETSIVISYLDEETRIELAPHSQLEIMSHLRGKHLRLRSGSLLADVAPQPETKPMRLFVNNSEAVVLGTRFSLNADPGKSALDVEKGAVRINRSESGESIVVSSHEQVDLDAIKLELNTGRSLPPSPWRDDTTLHFDFEDDGARPELRVGRVTGSPNELQSHGGCVAAELFSGENPHLKYGVSFRTRWIVEADSQVRMRYWAGPNVEMIQFNLHCDVGERGFLIQFPPAAHERWVEWKLSLSELRQVVADEHGQHASLPVGATANAMTIITARVGHPTHLYFDDLLIEHISRP